MIAQTLKAAAIGYRMVEEENALTNTEYYREDQERRALSGHTTPAEYAKGYDETDYALEYYSTLFLERLDTFAADYMREYYWNTCPKTDVYDVAAHSIVEYLSK